MKKIYYLVCFLFLTLPGYAQKQDTVIINLARTSKIIFTMDDPADLEILKHYNFDQLFEDILNKLEEKDRKRLSGADTIAETQKDDDYSENSEDEEEDDDSWRRRRDEEKNDNDDDDDNDWDPHHKRWNRTWQTFNFDLGTNNYLSNGKFPDDASAYAVRPWGSWYVGMSSVQRSRLAKKFFLEWGLGVSWYNFKFQDDNILLVKDDNGVQFTRDTRDVDFVKSKLSASYVQASLIPVLDFNDHSKKTRVWDGDKESFRIGLGPYIAYRISSHSKIVYEDDGKERDKDRDSFYLNNFRYGARLQVGYRSTDLFFNYDMNELFVEGKGPSLNAFSFGVIF